EVENTYINTPLDIYVLANDRHPLGSDLKLVEVQNPNYGLSKVVDADQGIVYYKPQRDFVGVDKFFYFTEDDQGQR
ncbi:MAG: Ig-like domain-containing protein, partial [Salibacteraceae bacterium]|nr:Ig-like domain-containing protein [Salibacteraceae bacterium]